jgi:hypothetical protein
MRCSFERGPSNNPFRLQQFRESRIRPEEALTERQIGPFRLRNLYNANEAYFTQASSLCRHSTLTQVTSSVGTYFFPARVPAPQLTLKAKCTDLPPFTARRRCMRPI